MARSVCFSLALLWAGACPAKILLDGDFAYLQESRTTSSTSTRTGSLYSAGLLVDATGKEALYLGAIVAAGSVTSSGGPSESFSHQDIILGGRWFVDRSRLLSVSLGYGVISRADFKESSSSPNEKWQGTSLYGKVSIAPEVRNWTMGVSLIYHQVNYTEKTSQGTTSGGSFQRTTIWPALSLGYKW